MRQIIACMLVSGYLVAPARASEKPLVLAWVDVPSPKKVYSPSPPYPHIAIQARVQGIVVLRVVVGIDGWPIEVEVERGDPLLHQFAIKTVRTWKYEPTVVDGSPRRVTVYEPLAFFLSDKKIAKSTTAWARGQRSKDPGALEVKLWAVSELTVRLSQERAAAIKGLEALASDADERVAKAARTALDAANAGFQ